MPIPVGSGAVGWCPSEDEPAPTVFSIDSIHDLPMTGDEPELSDLEPWSTDEPTGPHKYVFSPATH